MKNSARDAPNTDDDVLFRVERRLGWITLNRPRSINALTHDMVGRIDARLQQWAVDDHVAGIVLTGAGDRGLCAGGDIISIYHDARAGGRTSLEFWRDEYALNARIASYPKPYLALMDGIVMGGGVGLSAHGSIRVVTDRTTMAMPEVGIGFIPDVGGTWLLSRTPGQLGTHIAMTTGRFDGADAIVCGLADHYVTADRIPTLVDQLDGDTIGSAARELSQIPPASPLQRQQTWIDDCYAPNTVVDILERLRTHPRPAAAEAAEAISTKSPTALTVALRALRQARRLPTLRDALEQELRISAASLNSHDLVEGIRAQVIDKDRAPRWSPARLADVTPDEVDRYFMPVPADDTVSPGKQVRT